MHCSSYTNIIAALCCVGSDVSGAAGSKVVYGVLSSKTVDLLKLIENLLRPLIVVESLSFGDSSRTFVNRAYYVTLREQSNALRIGRTLTKRKTAYLCHLIRVGVCGRRNGSNTQISRINLCSPCGRIRSYSVWSDDVEELSALAHHLRLLSPGELLSGENKSVCEQFVLEVHLFFHAGIVEVADKLSVNCTYGRNTAGAKKCVFRPVSVETPLVVLLVNEVLKHLFEGIPVPSAFLVHLPGIVKAVSLDRSLVIDNDLLSFNACYELEVLSAEVEYFHGVLGILPDSGVHVNVVVNGLKHSADYSLGVVVNIVSGEEVDSLAAENKCGKIIVAVLPCGLIIFN